MGKSVLHTVRTGSEANPGSYWADKGMFSSGGKRGVRSRPSTFTSREEVKNAYSYCSYYILRQVRILEVIVSQMSIIIAHMDQHCKHNGVQLRAHFIS
jgi:hypothetical protein